MLTFEDVLANQLKDMRIWISCETVLPASRGVEAISRKIEHENFYNEYEHL